MTAEEIQMVVEQVLAKIGVTVKVHPDAPLPGQEWLSIKNVAILTGLCPSIVRRAIVGGMLVASDTGTKDHPHYRVSRDNLKMWMSEREHGAKPPTSRKATPVHSRHHKPKAARKQSA